ncbi:MAG: TolC family protein [Bacteroidaceae bacterium]|nr:TolC family protein [Bacteroidaceae bacterium]
MRIWLFILLLAITRTHCFSESLPDSLRLTLTDAIALAQRQSSDALAARHALEASEWSYRYFRANYLPSVSLSSSPSLNRQLNSITQPDGTNVFVRQNQLNTDLSLSISQNVALTGGTLFVRNNLQRIDEFEQRTHGYSSVPFSIGYQQNLFGHNSLRWAKRTEPLRYSIARKQYAETMELIASRTSSLFFMLASAQTNLEIARQNFAVSDTLLRYARHRYERGSITENEMLQLEVGKLTEETNRLNAEAELEDAMQTLRSYLGIKDDMPLAVILDTLINEEVVNADEALALALANNPDPEQIRLNVMESESALSAAKANRGLKADLYLQFGLSQKGTTMKEAYTRPLNQEYVSLSVSLPLLDWGRGKGQVRVAKSRLELTQTQSEQAMQDFRLNVMKMVRQYNLQAYRVKIAYRTRETALRRYEVARWLYMQGRTSLLEFNTSISEKDNAQRAFINALQTYWSLYYGLRSLTIDH